jgi:DNA-binding CsgD family transcriptional regulator
MSFAELPENVRLVAEEELTRKQLDVFRLWCAGMGHKRISIMLDMSPSTVRTHLARAQQKIEIAMRKEVAA